MSVLHGIRAGAIFLALIVATTWGVAVPPKQSPPNEPPLIGSTHGWDRSGLIGVAAADDLDCFIAATGDGHLLLAGKPGQSRRVALTPRIEHGRIVVARGGLETICLDEEFLRVHATETGKELARLKLDPEKKAAQIVAAARASIVLLSYDDGTLVSWDREAKPKERIQTAKVSPIYNLSISSDGRTIAVLSQPRDPLNDDSPQEIFVWQPDRQIAPKARPSPMLAIAVNLSPSGERLAIRCAHHTEILNVADWKSIAKSDQIHENVFCWTDEDSVVVVKSGRQGSSQIGRWSVSRQEWLWKIPGVPNPTPLGLNRPDVIRSLSVSAKRCQVVWVESNSLLGMCDLKTGKREAGWAGNENPQSPVLFSPGQQIVIGWKPGSRELLRWELTDNRPSACSKILPEVPPLVNSILLSECGEWLAAFTKRGEHDTGRDYQLKVVPLREGAGQPWEPKFATRDLNLVHLSRGGKELLVAADSEKVGPINPNTILRLVRSDAQPIILLPEDAIPKHQSIGICCSRSGRMICLSFPEPLKEAHSGLILQVWDLETKQQLSRTTEIPLQERILVGESGAWLLGMSNGKVALGCYETTQGEIWSIPGRSLHSNAQLSRDEHLLICVRNDVFPSHTEIRERCTGDLLCEINMRFEAVAFSNSSKKLLVYDTNRMIREVDWWSIVTENNKNIDQNPDKQLASMVKPGREGYGAMIRLAQRPKEACQLLASEVTDVATTPQRLQEFIAQLQHDDFDKRQQASGLINAIGPVAIPVLRIAFAQSKDPDLRKLLTELMHGMRGIEFHPAGLRDRRIVHMLESLNVPEARQLLRDFVAGNPLAYRTHYAKNALRRLEP